MRDPQGERMTVCGVRWDQMVARNAVDREDMCHNCVATYAWSNAGGDAALPPAIVEPPSAVRVTTPSSASNAAGA